MTETKTEKEKEPTPLPHKDISLDRKIFLYALASLAIVADIVTLYQAYISEVFKNHFSVSWMATIFIVVFLSAVAMSCVFIANRSQFLARNFALFWGLIYIIIACMIFQFNAIQHTAKAVSFSYFFGVIISTFIVGGFGILAISLFTNHHFDIENAVQNPIFRIPSYVLGINSIIYIYVLGTKYIGTNPFESTYGFIGEILLLTYCSTPFLWTFFESLKGETK